MKKWLIRIGLVIVVLLVATVVAVAFFLGSIVKQGVQTVGSSTTKVEVKLDSASVSLLSGSATLKGLVVGNPPGYKTESAMQLGEVSVKLKPMSVLHDKVVVESVRVILPEITFEGGLTENNLKVIEKNVDAGSSGGGSAPAASGSAKPQSGAGKKIEVDDLLVSGAKLHVKSGLLAGKMVTVPLPDIHLTDLGKGTDGITAGDLTKRLMSALMGEVVPAATKALSELGSDVGALGKGVEKEGTNALKKAAGGLKSILGQ